MKYYLGCDSHSAYSVIVSMDETGRASSPLRLDHSDGIFAELAKKFPEQTPIAVEASGGWYWVVDQLEAAGFDVRLTDPKQAKWRMVQKNKTDALDAKGLAMLLRNGTLPEVWIPSAQLRDLRGLLRTRLALRRQGTFHKNRISAAIRRYGIRPNEKHGDMFCGKGRLEMWRCIDKLPEQTRFATSEEWAVLDEIERRLKEMEERIRQRIGSIGWVRLLKSLPGVGEILSATIYLEIGDIARFPCPAQLASYAGLVPTIHSSGGHSHLGRTSKQSNHYLRWAFVEAANHISALHRYYENTHVLSLYRRLRENKGHNKAAVAVGRHLAESSWWVLKKRETYRQPGPVAAASSA